MGSSLSRWLKKSSGKIWLIVGGLLGASLIIGLPILRNQSRSNAASAAQLELGEAVYVENCASCHGVEGEGEYYPNPPQEPGPDGLLGAPPHDETGHTWHHADQLLLDTIRHGSTYEGFKPMPAFGDTLSDDEIEAVLVYIKTFWTDEQRALQANNSG